MKKIEVKTQNENYEVVAICESGFLLKKGTQKEYYAIIRRKNTTCQHFVVASSYDISDGTWGNGAYFNSLIGAMEYFKKII